MRPLPTALAVLLVLVAACTSDAPPNVSSTPTADDVQPADLSVVSEASSDALDPGEGSAPSPASSVPAQTAIDTQADAPLPVREGPRRETSGSVPHVQLEATPVPDVDA